MTVTWRSDFNLHCVVSNFAKRKWSEDTSGEDWTIYWASVQTVHRIFHPESARLEQHQMVNHFPNYVELSRKDLLVKNVKRYQKKAAKDASGKLVKDILPATFILPNDLPLFIEDFKKQPESTWIMKPANRAQGRGIFLINRLSQLKRWERSAPMTKSGAPETPLRVYISDLGFARFCGVPYDPGSSSFGDKLIHLTNVAIQRRNDDYNAFHGNKWQLSKLRLWLCGTQGAAATRKLFSEIDALILHSLRACQPSIINDQHCFELYGYDVIVDSDLRPWLIEVNAAPSLAASTARDRTMKAQLISDVLDIVLPNGALRGNTDRCHLSNTRPRSAMVGQVKQTEEWTAGPPLLQQTGSMRLLFDETAEIKVSRAAREAARAQVHRARRSTTLSCC